MNVNLEDVFVWTDPHFGHRKIMDFCAKTRPYLLEEKRDDKGKLIITDADINRMDDDLIERWNRRTKGKTIYCLGDFTFYRDENREKAEKIFNALHGDKHLIVGNHDHTMTKRFGWSSVSSIRNIRIGDQLFVMHHFPMSHWDRMVHGSIQLYGHVHGDPNVPGRDTLRMFEPAIDNGVDEPISLAEIVDKLKDKEAPKEYKINWF
jgi:calcineurin-like phosphoesterase family protein